MSARRGGLPAHAQRTRRNGWVAKLLTPKESLSESAIATAVHVDRAAQSVSGFFDEVVEDAMKARRVEATEGATHYLVALLADYAHPDRRQETRSSGR